LNFLTAVASFEVPFLLLLAVEKAKEVAEIGDISFFDGEIGKIEKIWGNNLLYQ
jgi:uncharacterized protein YkvS